MEAILKMAMVQTVLDTVTLLVEILVKADPADHKRIDEMIQRLTTMASAI